MKIQIIVATHKAYFMPADPMYLPVHVGCDNATVDLGFLGDNTGEHISQKNHTFCELTGLYWAWKNLDADYIGLSHYRRHFTMHPQGKRWENILTTQEAQGLLTKTDVLLPRKRNYYIETVYNQYIHSHPAEGLDLAIEMAAAGGTNYQKAVDSLKRRTWYHNYNMFLMKREILDGYCSWLFPILFEMEQRLDLSGYSAYDRRVFGFVAERLLDVYLEAEGIRYQEVPVMFMEKENWLKKGGSFLFRKFTGKRGE